MTTVDIREVAHMTKLEAGRLVLAEAYKDLGKADDQELRKLRKAMIGKHAEKLKAFQELGDDRYSTPAGNGLMRDMGYYGQCITRIEGEMQYRMLTLD